MLTATHNKLLLLLVPPQPVPLLHQLVLRCKCFFPVSSSSHNLTSPSTTKCLLKTAVANVRAGSHRCSTNILLDEGAQQSFISQKLVEYLQTSPCDTVTISISAFGGISTPSTLQSTSIQVVTKTGEEVTLSVRVVPTIATPLKITNLVYQAVEQLPYHEVWIKHIPSHIPSFLNIDHLEEDTTPNFVQRIGLRELCGNNLGNFEATRYSRIIP